MSHSFVDKMLEQSKAGKLRSPVSETLEMHLVDFARGEATYEMEARAELGNPLGVIQGGVATALPELSSSFREALRHLSGTDKPCPIENGADSMDSFPDKDFQDTS